VRVYRKTDVRAEPRVTRLRPKATTVSRSFSRHAHARHASDDGPEVAGVLCDRGSHFYLSVSGLKLARGFAATLKAAHLTIRVQFIPLSREELLPALLDGKGDVVMANLTVTPERKEIVDFAEPGSMASRKSSSHDPAGRKSQR
jgi:hypothetical protein